MKLIYLLNGLTCHDETRVCCQRLVHFLSLLCSPTHTEPDLINQPLPSLLLKQCVDWLEVFMAWSEPLFASHLQSRDSVRTPTFLLSAHIETSMRINLTKMYWITIMDWTFKDKMQQPTKCTYRLSQSTLLNN